MEKEEKQREEKKKVKEETKLWIVMIWGFVAMFGLMLLAEVWGLWYPPETFNIVHKGMAWGMGVGALAIFVAHESGRLVGLILYKRYKINIK